MIDFRKLFRSIGVALNLRDPPHIPAYGWSYFDHLVAVYVTLNASDPRADAVIKKSRDTPDDLTWGDIFILESVSFSLQPPEVVDRSAWILRERFREIAGPSVYNKYVESKIPVKSDTASLPALKADLTRIMDVLHWYYSLIPMRERIRKSLTVACMVMVMFYTCFLAGTLIWCSYHGADFLAMLASVLYCGVIGGFVSSQRRMQTIPNDGDPLMSVFGLDNSGYYLWLSPLLGAIFSVTLMAMFIAGIFKGALFPEFYLSLPHVGCGVHQACGADFAATQGLPFFHFTWNTVPKNSEEYGKLFLWAFLAGFAERLVPDNLDRLAAKLDMSEKKKAATPNLPPGGGTDNSAPLAVTAPAKITPESLDNALHTGQSPPNPAS